MKHGMSVLTLMALPLVFGCGGEEVAEDATVAHEATAAGKIPRWFLKPQIDDTGMYAAGVSTGVQDMQLALSNAENNARTKLAKTFSSRVQSVFKKYIEHVRSAAGVHEEAHVQETNIEIINEKVRGVVNVMQEPGENGAWFVLVKLPYESVDLVVQQAIRDSEIKEIRDNAAAAYDEMRQLIREEAANER